MRMNRALFLAAWIAASFIRFSRSAPENPGVVRAIWCKSTSSASGLPFTWTLRISSLPFTSGLPTATLRSKRPGLKIAGSRISTRFVAAITMIPSFTPKPSISTRSWFNVCSLSSWPPPSPVHFHKVRTGNREERYSCLSCHCFGKKSLTCSWRTY